MFLHTETLFWVLSLGYTANILLALILYLWHNEFPGAPFWIIAQIFVALGTILQALRDQIPYPLLVLGNVLLLAAGVSYINAARGFRHKKYSYLLFLIPIILALPLFLLEEGGINTRTMVFGASNAILQFIIFWTLVHKINKEERFPLWLVAFPFFATSLGSGAQFLTALWLESRALMLSDLGLGYTLILLFSILTSTLAFFGYYLLSGIEKQRVIKDSTRLLRRSNRALQESNRTKDLFVSVIAHDLIGPISGSARYVRKHLLQPGVDLEAKLDSLEVLVLSLEKTQNFLQNLLWWSRSQQEAWTQNPQPIDLKEIMESSITLFRPNLAMKEQKLISKLNSAPVKGDKESIQLIFNNLLSNAIKFSPPFSEIEIETDVNIQGHAQARVTDQGVGIPAELRERLFEIEHKVSTLGTSGENGNGMGLILCWEFAKRNEATLILTSEPGMGTTVFLRFQKEPV